MTASAPGPAAPDDPGGGAADLDALVATVARLRAEADGLRAAMRTRALIEQAKGMMMERHGDDPDQAFRRLATLSQHANLKVVDVAAALVAAALPEGRNAAVPAGDPEPPRAVTPADLGRSLRARPQWPRQGDAETPFRARLRGHGRLGRIRTELLAAQIPSDVMNTVIQVACEDFPPDRAALAAAGLGGVVTLVAWHGTSPAEVARWQGTPAELPIAACRAVATGQALWSPPEPPPAAVGFGLDGDLAALALLPLRAEGSCAGVLGLAWAAADPITPARRAHLQQLADAVAGALRRLPAGSGTALAGPLLRGGDPSLAVLDVIQNPVLLAEPVPDGEGRIADLRIRYANSAAAGRAGLGIGWQQSRTVLELWPQAAANGVLATCRRVLTGGAPGSVPDLRLAGAAGTARAGIEWDLRVVRYRDGVLITWQPAEQFRQDASGDD
jgi:ANTAR domain/GAF domain